MRIVLVDNYDRGFIEPVEIAKGLQENYAHRIARLLNEEEEELNGDTTPNYYMVKDEVPSIPLHQKEVIK